MSPKHTNLYTIEEIMVSYESSKDICKRQQKDQVKREKLETSKDLQKCGLNQS